MNRTQIYLSPARQQALKSLAAKTGRTQIELMSKGSSGIPPSLHRTGGAITANCVIRLSV